MGEKQHLPVFSCDLCGLCCRMSPISILPHEEAVLKRLAEEMDISVTFTHGYTIYEAVSGVNLALSYVMQLLNNRCPFLEENKCRLHYVYKPSVCRGFPYIPRQVRYSIDDINKYIVASTDYGLSLACHIVKRDREVLEKYRDNPGIIVHYIKQEYLTSIETENIRGLLLTSLSKLWRDGLVEIRSGKPNAPVVNLYDFLRQFFPDLPNLLGMDKVVYRMRKCLKTY